MNTESILRKVEEVTESHMANNENVSPMTADIAENDIQKETLRDSVERSLRNYFDNLDGQPVSDVYDMVLSEIEAPLLETVMKYTRDNQTKASIVLGLNRGTLRKKLKQYGML